MLVNNDSFTKGMKYKKYSACKGFSLLEVMTAIFLITAGLLAAVTLLVSGLKDSMDSRNQITAGLLAQEGVELARNIRDNNWANGRSSFNDLPNNKDDCPIDMNSNSVQPGDCNSSADLNLYYNNGFYVKNPPGGTGTKFKRKLEFSTSGNQLTVTSMVVWGGNFYTVANCNATNKCVYTEIVLTKWGE